MPKPKTNITKEHKHIFNALISGDYDNFALVSCFVNGKPTAAIAAVTQHAPEADYEIHPLFVAITDDMTLTDHDGRQA